MRSFIILTYLIATVLARPEVAGYNYDRLQNGLSQNVHPHVHQQLPAEHSFADFAAPSTSYGSPAVASTQATPDHLQQLDNIDAPIENAAQPGQSPSSLAQQDDSYNMAYQKSINSYDLGGYAYTPQTTIHKHIYVHVAPKEFEDEDVITTRVHHQPAPKQKHYKIVFIKAPAAPSIRPPVVPPPPQSEEKTLIYVLHRRPELEQDIVIPAAAPTNPSKPEVYFIKYKTKKEEAPVYGPPPLLQQQQQQQQLDAEPRNINDPILEYGAPDVVDTFQPESHDDPTVSLTTIQPVTNGQDISEAPQQLQQQFAAAEVPSNSYGAPTIKAVIVPEEPQPTLAAPNKQYLAPETPHTMPPIVVEDTQHAPSNTYGPPNRFFNKKKK